MKISRIHKKQNQKDKERVPSINNVIKHLKFKQDMVLTLA
jgi:hypothetical protein